MAVGGSTGNGRAGADELTANGHKPSNGSGPGSSSSWSWPAPTTASSIITPLDEDAATPGTWFEPPEPGRTPLLAPALDEPTQRWAVPNGWSPLAPAPAPIEPSVGSATSLGSAGSVADDLASSPPIDASVIDEPPPAPEAPAAAPASVRRRGKPRVRRVTRVVRRVDAWSVLKLSVIFFVTLYVVALTSGLLLWSVAVSTGTINNVESVIETLFGLQTFTFDGRKLFEASWVLGALAVVAGTLLSVTLAVIFNLICDLTGGIRVTVLEEEVQLERPVRAPRRWSRGAADGATDEVSSSVYTTIEQRRDEIDATGNGAV